MTSLTVLPKRSDEDRKDNALVDYSRRLTEIILNKKFVPKRTNVRQRILIFLAISNIFHVRVS